MLIINGSSGGGIDLATTFGLIFIIMAVLMISGFVSILVVIIHHSRRHPNTHRQHNDYYHPTTEQIDDRFRKSSNSFYDRPKKETKFYSLCGTKAKRNHNYCHQCGGRLN